MNLHHLRYFITLAKLEHYTLAAKQLHITQPTLSHAISSLEYELGVTLFEKKGRNIVLTKIGQQFFERVTVALDLLDDSFHEMELLSKGAGNIDIALLRTLGFQLVPNLIRNFLKENPEKEIHFGFYNDTGMSEDIINGLREQKYDIGFCSKIDDAQDIHFVPIAEQELVVITSLGHPLASKDGIHLEETLDYPQIWFAKRSGLRSIQNQLFEDIAKKPNIQYEIEEDESIAGFVAQGFGIAVLPYIPILDMMDVKIIKLKNLKYRRLHYMAYLKNAVHSPAVQSLIQYIKDKKVLSTSSSSRTQQNEEY